MRLLIVHTLAYLLIGLLWWCCTLIAPLRWWDLGLYLSFYPEWDKLLVQPWSLVTYALPHLNLFHFLGNMCLLYVLLPAMEQRLGARHFLTAYVGGIIAGSLAYLLAYQIVGASLLPPLSLQGASAALLSALVACTTAACFPPSLFASSDSASLRSCLGCFFSRSSSVQVGGTLGDTWRISGVSSSVLPTATTVVSRRYDLMRAVRAVLSSWSRRATRALRA